MQAKNLEPRWRLFAIALMVACVVSPAKSAIETQYVICDDDWTATSAIALMPILAAPNTRILGLTTVTGDVWRDQGRQEVSEFLETLGIRDIPIITGAQLPLANTRAKMRDWERSYGRIPWKGVWNEDKPPPAQMPLSEDAAAFLVRQIRAHPHQVTIYADGPLTNLALALQRDPEIASLTKQLVFTGGNLTQFKANDTIKSDFNFIFDPEAADIVLRAAWPKLINLGDAADAAVMTTELQQRLLREPTVAARYIVNHAGVGSTQWGLLASTIIADPEVVTATLEVKMAVELGPGMFRGRARAWLPSNAPATDAPFVRIVRKVDLKRYADDVVENARASYLMKTP